MTKHNVICMIPARIGSQRFKQKNLALIENKTVLEWGIMDAKKSKVLDFPPPFIITPCLRFSEKYMPPPCLFRPPLV